jgi:hypothetical protein
MKQIEKQRILQKMKKSEELIMKGQSDLSSLSKFVQPFFEEEITVVWSTDGSVITDKSGELGSFEDFLNRL